MGKYGGFNATHTRAAVRSTKPRGNPTLTMLLYDMGNMSYRMIGRLLGRDVGLCHAGCGSLRAVLADVGLPTFYAHTAGLRRRNYCEMASEISLIRAARSSSTVSEGGGTMLNSLRTVGIQISIPVGTGSRTGGGTGAAEFPTQRKPIGFKNAFRKATKAISRNSGALLNKRTVK